jgi:RluA family pseudouridine synthase
VAEILARGGADAGAIAEGRVFCGRRRVKSAAEPVREGDEIIVWDAPRVSHSRPPDLVVERHDDLVFVVKPSGIPTIPDHAGAAHSLLARAAKELGMDPSRLHPTSRLDREVSGVVLFALSPAAAARLKEARAQGRYVRRYVALASCVLEPESGVWDAPIGRAGNPRHRKAFGRDAAPAKSLYRTVAHAGETVLLALAPVTGRTHQLRVHAGYAGAPLLGDRVYGGAPRVTLPTGRVIALGRVMLHAARVVVPRASSLRASGARDASSSLRASGARDVSSTEPVAFEAPVPEEMRGVWTALGGASEAWDTAIRCELSGGS